MRGDLLDVVLLAVVVAFAVSGYRQGFIVGALSFAGFIGGGVFGAFVAPPITRRIVTGSAQQALLAIVIVFLAATIGQFLTSSIGSVVRDRVTWHPARLVDAVGGAAVSVVSVLLVAWLIGSAVVGSPFPLLRTQVNGSAVLQQVDRVMPDAIRHWFASFRRLVSSSAFPQVFSGLGSERIVDVPAPDQAVLNTPALRAARHSVVKITGTAPSCDRRIEGSGFVFARHRVMTNAHVVAGVREGPEVYGPDGRRYGARVVVYDPERDVAVLYVPELDLSPLRFDGNAAPGDSAVVAGYPRNEPFTAVPARVRGEQRAKGPDIYQASTVIREIYSLRARVEPGNSGGPLLSPDGAVYGVVFAAAVDDPETGYALTFDEVAPDARAGREAVRAVSTQQCD